jgi:hypothetical protein
MDHALSCHLAKCRVGPEDEIWHVDKAWIVRATAEGRGRIADPAQGRRDVEVLDQTVSMATVKIVSERFVDFPHLAMCGDRRRIVDVLWDGTTSPGRRHGVPRRIQ